ncbi:Ccw12p Ecym_4269 [Eremothecium cymbalariae DBVPG|uniref:Uncharacterized protein n=1 Tax=Eremothecium cymbalariae (strain CBS 270.75 / DBVPG 7215 / KCTC 17166 / NRRL Y-17582) TaxID=931890 RepID=G8JTI0_ERECY|nr:hypothetical protein Ecym_4269 [Eremothecium cymbalariae DBVPG\
MQFSTVAAVAASAAVASAHANHANTTTTTAHYNATTLVTITSCGTKSCVESVSVALVSTATVSVGETITEYTTWCPLPTSAPEAPASSAPSSVAVPSNSTVPASATASVSSYTGGAVKALPAAGALFAGAAALLL